ncbi:MAG: FmdE family protein, partial [Anaerolineales bacterium]|nr:FmdE family protein [Anaerolineales bacterium]
MKTLRELLDASAALHRHLCPRQVLGVRMGLLAGEVLGLALPQTDKRLLTIAETNGCAVDGLSVATGCWVGRRTLRIEDFGKVAATFVDTHTGRAVRIAPRAGCRERARDYAPEARNRWEAQLLGYQRMPNEALLSVQSVQLKVPVAQLISRPGVRTLCDLCGEEIMNKREIVREGQVLCRACAGESYYLLTADFAACAGWASEVRLAAAPFIPQTSPLQRGVHAKVVREQAAPSTAASLR